MKTFVEKLLDAEDVRHERPHGVIVVGTRALPGELEERERESIARMQAGELEEELPIPFYEDYSKGILEPPSAADLKVLERLGVSQDEYEILVLEDRLERMERK